MAGPARGQAAVGEAGSHLVGLEQPHADLHAPPLAVRHLVEPPAQIDIEELYEPDRARVWKQERRA